jgi:hypothetical protein
LVVKIPLVPLDFTAAFFTIKSNFLLSVSKSSEGADSLVLILSELA